MSAKDVAQAAMMAWEAKDANALGSCLSDDFAGRGFLPQHIEKQQFIDLMKALTRLLMLWRIYLLKWAWRYRDRK